MKLLTFVREGEYRLGVKLDGGVLDVAGASLHQTDMPSTIEQLLKGGAAARAALQDLVARSLDAETELLDEAALTLAPCVNHPGKIICVGLNYLRHARRPTPKYPNIRFCSINSPIRWPDTGRQSLSPRKRSSRL